MNQTDKEAFDYILDTMTGADGGLRFVNYMAMVRAMSERADKGDRDARILLDKTVHSFKKFIEISQR